LDEKRATRNAQRVTPVDRVRAALAAHGLDSVEVREYSASTATAADAAAAIGTTVARIVKSLVFMAADRPILVLVSGPNRVDPHKLEGLLDAPVKRANADQVRDHTGYAIGGVPPIGHPSPMATFVDPDLLEFDEVWAAAGTPNTLFAIQPPELVRITGAQVADIT
jgi:prolyl-tRNA editing enzyme YbaK/EbsC (Cys-tRNA(Pro) deacylase)